MRLPPRRHDRPFVRGIFFLVAATALLFGIVGLSRSIHLLRRAVHTTGHVAARPGAPDASESGAHPDISFTDATGRSVTYNQNGMGSRPVGAPIPVLYDPADPAGTATADSWWQIWPTTVLPFFLSIAFAAGALWGEVLTNLDNYLDRQRMKQAS